ncbi:diguanylate cyclase (GGDEF)-like protein [Paucibacter oligotrophus]|uniref:Diguanylate cyclase (GGDEF)-like protein n=1 Tax=Roseateles oligotrophus TaxID=1769250 RepID=A0A840L5M5_9BURK|nr:EAL domain-containing protein [Roseateles oligotrophus]MBB4843326.1 diguanylate cyclase (GGDEF)-like protein [Roseateles oligotrophus]
MKSRPAQDTRVPAALAISGYRPSLRTAIAVPFALILCFTVGFQALTRHQQVNDLVDQEGHRLLAALTNSSRDRLALFLDEPFHIQRDIADAIGRHELYKPGDLQPIHQHLLGVYRDLYAAQHQLSVLSFGSEAGEYVGLRREGEDFSLMLKDRSTAGQLHIYAGPQRGAVTASFPNYDPRGRPWYAPIAQQGKAGWTPLYTNRDERQQITLSAATPVLREGKLLGVMEADLDLAGLNHFLIDEPLRGQGVLLIVDKLGRLVAHSERSSVVAEENTGSNGSERLRMSDSPSRLVRAAAAQVDAGPAGQSHEFELRLGGERFFCRVIPYFDARGLDWRIVALLPESDLLGDAREAGQRVTWLVVLVALLGLGLGLWVLSWVTRPIHHTVAAANQLAQGRWDAPHIEHGRLQETAILVHAFTQMSERLQRSFDELRDQLRYDGLTQLLTRRGLLEQAQWMQERPAVLCLVGLDAFRAINDNVGYGTADSLLQAVAQRLRESQAPETLMARVGGDEFVILYFDFPAPPAEAASAAAFAAGERLHALFGKPFASGDDEVLVSASVGLVGGQLAVQALPEWLRNASVALGEAKRRGHGSVVLFEPGMMEASRQRAQLAQELRHALQGQQFLVHYQPVIALASGEATGAEALLRWQSPERGMVPPAVFIPVAEESDLILGLGLWVLRQATRDIAAQLHDLPAGFELHVNLSARQLIQSDFVEQLRQALADSGLPAQHLTLELTESLLLGGDAAIEARLREIRALGVKIAIDDFGTGYSSLAYLSRLPFDCLKIDQSFVRKLGHSSQDAAIVSAVLNMAEGFGVDVVAEGVETEADALLLRQMGCAHAQGYFFGHPTPLGQCDWRRRGLGTAPPQLAKP